MHPAYEELGYCPCTDCGHLTGSKTPIPREYISNEAPAKKGNIGCDLGYFCTGDTENCAGCLAFLGSCPDFVQDDTTENDTKDREMPIPRNPESPAESEEVP